MYCKGLSTKNNTKMVLTYLVSFVYYQLVQDSSFTWTFFCKKPCIYTINSYIYISTLLFLLHVKITCGYDVIGVAWQTSALSVRVRVPLSAYYIYLSNKHACKYCTMTSYLFVWVIYHIFFCQFDGNIWSYPTSK